MFKHDSGTWTRVTDIADYQPTSMCVNIKGEIIIGIRYDNGKLRSHVCLIFLQNGDKAHQNTVDDLNMKYKSINQCVVLKNDTICLSETDESLHGRVVKLNKDKSFALEYDRNYLVSPNDCSFCPVSLSTTALDNLVVLTKIKCA